MGKKITFYQVDVTDGKAVDTIFSNHRIDGIIHYNLMPYITQVAKGKLEKLKVFGNAYYTDAKRVLKKAP